MTALGEARPPRIVRASAGFPGPRLQQIWETKPGVIGWFATVDHKEIGLRYIVTAFIFLVLGGLEAMVMRAQLARPEERLLSPEAYDQLFTMHGMTMIFLYASPVLTGFNNYLWPLLLSARDMAFPRLNALSYWIYLAAGCFLYAGFVVGRGPDAGWFDYVPYAELGVRTRDPSLQGLLLDRAGALPLAL
jgi:cytochrome c oxidase subunit 1/cytochrome c oxidase subunit I+III